MQGASNVPVEACLYGSTCATFQSPWELFIVLRGHPCGRSVLRDPRKGGPEGQEVSPSNRMVGEGMGK